MYTFRQWTVDKKLEVANYLITKYNSMIDSSKVKTTDILEMSSILNWTFEALHRLYPLNILDDNGSPFADLNAFNLDIETNAQLEEVLGHNVILLVNNWRQTQFFQVDDNGRDVIATTNDGYLGSSMDNGITNSANYSYNWFDVNIKADKNLQQVSELLKQIKAEFEQFLDVYGGAGGNA